MVDDILAIQNCSNSVKILEPVDERLLRALVGGHDKTPLEFLSGSVPIRYLIS